LSACFEWGTCSSGSGGIVEGSSASFEASFVAFLG